MGGDSDSSPQAREQSPMSSFTSSAHPSQPTPGSVHRSQVSIQPSLSTDLEVPFSPELSLPTASDITSSNPLLYRLSRSISSLLDVLSRAPPAPTGQYGQGTNSSPNVSDLLPPGLLSPDQSRRSNKGHNNGSNTFWGGKNSRGRSCLRTSVLWLLALLVVSGLLVARVTTHHHNHHQSIRGKHRDANGWLVLDHFLGHGPVEHNRQWDDEETNTLFGSKMWQALSEVSTKSHISKPALVGDKTEEQTGGKEEEQEQEEQPPKEQGEEQEGSQQEGEQDDNQEKAEGETSQDKEKGESEEAASEKAEDAGDGQTAEQSKTQGQESEKANEIEKKPQRKADAWEDATVIRKAQDMVNKDGEIVSLGTRVVKEDYSLLPNALELARLQLEMEKGLMQALTAVKKIKQLNVAKHIHGGAGVGEDHGYVAICTIAKDQNADVCEWLQYHHYVLGVQTFYVFDHESKVPLMANITGCIPLQHVVYSYINTPNIRGGPLETPQMYAYNQCIMRSKGMHQWMAFIDMDEFITVTQPIKLADFLKPYEKYGALGLNWRMFGSSGHVTRPKQDVLAAYADCLPNTNHQNTHTKAIVNMHHVVGMNQPHYPTLKPGHVMVDTHERKTSYAFVKRATYDRAFIAHYVLKSHQEYGWKMERGSAMKRHKSWSYFNSTNQQMSRQCPWGRALSKCSQYLATVANSSTNCFCKVSYIAYRTCIPAQEVVTGFCIVNGTSQPFSQPLDSIPVPKCVLPPVPANESDEELDLDAEEEAIKRAAIKSHGGHYDDIEEDDDQEEGTSRNETAVGQAAKNATIPTSKDSNDGASRTQKDVDADGGKTAAVGDATQRKASEQKGESEESGEEQEQGESAQEKGVKEEATSAEDGKVPEQEESAKEQAVKQDGKNAEDSKEQE